MVGPAEVRSSSSTHMHTAMDAALSAALLGVRGANPLVGAAVVAADGTIVTGHHRGAGTAHAEVDALARAREAGIDLTSAAVCVTLEPCSHRGRTGPCAELLIDAGVAEVVVAIADPNPSSAGGCPRLREAGIPVTAGVREAEARHLNARWLRAIAQERPYVTLKIAQSLDGRIAAQDGTSQWITSAMSRQRVHALRSRVDAVLVGTGTAHADDPRLTARPAPSSDHPASSAQPVPVVMGLRDLDPGSHLAHDPRTVHVRTRAPLGALHALKQQGIEHVLVEGGAHVAAAFVQADLVDELELHIAPILLGDGLPGLADLGVSTLSQAYRWVPDTASQDVPHPDSALTLEESATPDASPSSGTPSSPDTILRLLPHEAGTVLLGKDL